MDFLCECPHIFLVIGPSALIASAWYRCSVVPSHSRPTFHPASLKRPHCLLVNATSRNTNPGQRAARGRVLQQMRAETCKICISKRQGLLSDCTFVELYLVSVRRLA